MTQQTSGHPRTGGRLFLAVLLTCTCFCTTLPALSIAGDRNTESEIQQQILTQGRLLLGNLRRAREMGLRGDPWAMATALQEAQRMVNQIDQAEHLLYARHSPKEERTALRQRPKLSIAPLDERLDIDVPLSGGRRHRLADLDQYAGFIPLRRVRAAIEQASQDLNTQPPDLGRALMTTNRALSDIHWQAALQPSGWTQARDLALQGYTLALNSRPGAFDRLVRARRKLRSLPGGGVYARRLATLLWAPTLQTGALRALVQDLDQQVQMLRGRAERLHLERAGVELSP
jgi:hypothetical protein